MTGPAQKRSTAAVKLPPGVVQNQLERILSSRHFVDAPRLKRFLEYIVEQSAADSDARLKGYTIGLEVFDRPADFDPQVDTIVRVQAGQLRRRLDLYYADEGREDPLRIFVPKGSYGAHFQLLIDKDDADPEPSALQSGAPAGSRRPSIAVLPFDNFGGDPKDQFFADGLTEETIANLARFRDLFVFSRTTTAKLARDGADVRQLRDELGADFVLEGSVRKSAETVRATVQLIDAATDGHIFAERFERPGTPAGIFEIQDEIAGLIAGRIGDRYGPIGRYAARSQRSGQATRLETYDWIARFYAYYADHDPERHAEIRDGLAEALLADESSSDGWAALSLVLLDEYRLHINERPGFPALDHAGEHAQRAVDCDPENAFAYLALALVHFHRREFATFSVAADRAISLNPGYAVALADIGFCHMQLGDWDRALTMLDRAIDLSPVHPGWYRHPLAIHQMMSGDAQAAIHEIKSAPMVGFFWHHALLAWFHAETGDADAAAAECRALLDVYPDFSARARRELEIWCSNDVMLEKAIAGWRKAGLDID